MTSRSAGKYCLANLQLPTAIFLLCFTSIASAQAFKTVVEFDGTHGGNPQDVFVQGTDGNYYGTAAWGGDYGCHDGLLGGCGTVIRVTATGQMQTLYTFCLQSGCPDGGNPYAGLVLGMDGNFYGTTSFGGTNCQAQMDECGTVFKISPEGQLTTLHTFCTQQGCPDGASPSASLFLAADGNFYGTTTYGGPDNFGTLFKITPAGNLATLFSFIGAGNPATPLVQAPDGNFYGTTTDGGYFSELWCSESGCGWVFRMTPAGTVTILYSFCQDQYACSDGAVPYSGLTVGNDGNLYGTTYFPEGTIYKITPQGDLTTLYSFQCVPTGCPIGLFPQGTLTLATDGNFYGTTGQGGTGSCVNIENCGLVYQLTPGGNLTVLHEFQGSDGGLPLGGITQTTRGYLEGTTYYGAMDGPCVNSQQGCGTVFAFSMGLGPSTAFVNNPGKVGQRVGILGQGLRGTTAVSFHGIPASFSVVSDTYITATVPTGATTGYVQVATTKGTLTSGRPYVVLR